MKEFVKKLIERLEEYKTKAYVTGFTNNPYELGACHAMDDAKKIVDQLAEEYNNDFCEWRLCDEEANVYDTTCRNPHILIEGSPTDNNYEYCPYCGKKIKVVPY